MAGERGQASVEWLALVLVGTLVLGGLLTGIRAVDGRSLGAALAHRLVCAARGGCDDGGDSLRRAYGVRDAELVRRHLPGLVFEPGEAQLPVDWRSCRAVRCAVGRDDGDVHRTAAGERATAFTRVLRRGERRYIQYWFYYPDSNTAWGGSDELWNRTPVGWLGGLVTGSRRYPGFHADDWEGAMVRVEPDGRAAIRVTSHGHWQWCKHARCAGRWGPTTGWTRVSRGSHAGHVPIDLLSGSAGRRPRRGDPLRHRRQLPGHDLQERTATADAIRLVPLETVDKRRYRRLDHGIAPPWQKDVYRNPNSPGS